MNLKGFRAIFTPKSSLIKTLKYDVDGDATGIETIEGTLIDGNAEIYNLSGQRVSTPARGIYIVNGKKVLVK